jgi:hypothetical protein
MRKLTWRLLAALFVLVLVATACSSDDDDSSSGSSTEDSTASGEASGTTIEVPGDHETIQAAVDAASPGDLILIEPGTYEEAVNVTTDDLTIRGLDRNEVILEGGFDLENGVRILEADGVAVENMTLQNYTRNGVFWTGSDGYRGSYLTAIRNGDYGVYAFGSVNGVLEHSYGSGSPDAGFYIGQCYPCNALIDDVVSEYNGLGYSGTNSGGDLFIVNSTFRLNRAGIVPNSGSYEGCAPERETTVVGNLVYDNSNYETSAIDAAVLGGGNGILVTGGVDNVIERNRVSGHDIAGIAVTPFPEDDPISGIPEDLPAECVEDAQAVSEEEQASLDNPLLWPATGNQVIDNVVSDSGRWDIVFISNVESENCAEGNEAQVISPADFAEVMPCGGPFLAYDAETGAFLEIVEADKPPSLDYQDVELPDPGDLENMPDAADAPAEPAGAPRTVDVDSIQLPDAPS